MKNWGRKDGMTGTGSDALVSQVELVPTSLPCNATKMLAALRLTQDEEKGGASQAQV